MTKITRGDAFREAVRRDYEITTPADVELVEECARLLDLCDDLDQDVRTNGRTSTGSQGQPVQSPSLVALQSARGELRMSLKALALPALGDGA